MRVVIDKERCTGHGRCYAVAPDVFDADDDGFGVVIGPQGPLSDELVRHAQLAAANCPEAAIQVIA